MQRSICLATLRSECQALDEAGFSLAASYVSMAIDALELAAPSVLPELREPRAGYAIDDPNTPTSS